MVKLMTKVMAPMVIVLAIGMAATQVLGAQAMLANSDTAALRAAKNEIFVLLAGTSVEIHGRLTVFDRTALTMEADGRSFTFPSNEVLRIDVISGTSPDKGVRGAFIGGLVMGAWCALVCGQGLDSGSQLPVAVATNGGIGAAIGGLIGYSRDGRKTIYKSTGTGAAIARRPNDLPCPATPLVLTAEVSATDLGTLPQTWTPVPQSQVFGASSCDGITIQRHYDSAKSAWQPGVEIAAGRVDASSIDVRVRVTVRNPEGGRDKKALVDIGLRQDGRSQVTSIFSIDADADEETSRDVVLHVPRALLSSPLSLQVTLTTSYAR